MEKKARLLNLRISDEDMKRLKEEAKALRLTVSSLVRLKVIKRLEVK